MYLLRIYRNYDLYIILNPIYIQLITVKNKLRRNKITCACMKELISQETSSYTYPVHRYTSHSQFPLSFHFTFFVSQGQPKKNIYFY